MTDREPLSTEESFRCAVIMNFVTIRATMFELCAVISGAVVFYLYSVGAGDAPMTAPVTVCGYSLMSCLIEKKRLGRLQKLYDRLD